MHSPEPRFGDPIPGTDAFLTLSGAPPDGVPRACIVRAEPAPPAAAARVSLGEAQLDGTIIGRQLGGDAWKLAGNLVAAVYLVEPAELLAQGRGTAPRAGKELVGLVVYGPQGENARIYLSLALGAQERQRTLAHECAHLRWAEREHDEAAAEAFAAAFVAQAAG